jgi:hypothetical protein
MPVGKNLVDVPIVQELFEEDIHLQRLKLRLPEERAGLGRVVEIEEFLGQLAVVVANRPAPVGVKEPQVFEECEIEVDGGFGFSSHGFLLV